MSDHPNGEYAKTEGDPAARRDRILAKAAETLERLKWQAVEHEAWLNAPDRREIAEAADEWIAEYNRRKLDGRA